MKRMLICEGSYYTHRYHTHTLSMWTFQVLQGHSLYHFWHNTFVFKLTYFKPFNYLDVVIIFPLYCKHLLYTVVRKYSWNRQTTKKYIHGFMRTFYEFILWVHFMSSIYEFILWVHFMSSFNEFILWVHLMSSFCEFIL